MNERKRNMKLAGIKENFERELSIHYPTDYANKLAQLLNDKQKFKSNDQDVMVFRAQQVDAEKNLSMIEVLDSDGHKVGLLDKKIHGTPNLDKMAQDVYYESLERRSLKEAFSINIDTDLSVRQVIDKLSMNIGSDVTLKAKDDQTILVTMRADPEFAKVMENLFGMPSFLIDASTTIHINKTGKGLVNEIKHDQIYFKSFSEAVQFAREKAEKKGFTIDEDDWFNRVNTGSGKPSIGETFSTSIGLFKNGKKVNQTLNIQVYGMKNSYELTSYIA